jgi:hypothetical protein
MYIVNTLPSIFLSLALLTIIFLKLFLIGYPVTHFIESKLKNKEIRLTGVSSLVGASILTTLGMLYVEGLVTFSGYCKIAYPILFFGIFYFITKNLKIISIKTNVNKLFLYTIAILIVYLILNPSHNNELYVRLNIDIPSYIASTKFILGDTLNDVGKAMVENSLLNGARWGLPLIAAFMKVSTSQGVYEILFCVVFSLLISSIIFCSEVLLISLKNSYEIKNLYLNSNYKFLFFLTLIFSSPIIFFFNEGFYPQIISVSFFWAYFAIFFVMRVQAQEKILYFLPVVIFLQIGITSNYNQSLFFLTPIIIMITFFDFLNRSYEKLKIDVFFIVALFIGLIFISPILKSFILNQLTFKAAGVGYPQPNWLFPSEILGFGGIYDNAKKFFDYQVSTRYVSRSSLNLIFSTLFSFILIALIYRGSKIVKDNVFIFSMLFFLFLIFIFDFCFSYLGLMKVGYAYNKIICFFIPFLMIFLFHALPLFTRRISFLIICLIVLSGLSTLKDLSTFSTRFNSSSLVDINNHMLNCECIFLTDERGIRNGLMVRQARYVDRTYDLFLRESLSAEVIDQWRKPKIESNNRYNKIFLLLKKSASINHSNHSYISIYENMNYIVLDTGLIFGDLESMTFKEVLKVYDSVFRAIYKSI